MEAPTNEDPGRIKGLLEDQLRGIWDYLEYQRRDSDHFNSRLESIIRGAIQNRRERIAAHDGLIQILGIPLKRKQGAPEIRPLPIRRNLVRPIPQLPQGGFSPDPGITAEDYDHMLGVIRHEGRTFEATPATYAVHDEEELRDILSAHLNGHYQGEASGEPSGGVARLTSALRTRIGALLSRSARSGADKSNWTLRLISCSGTDVEGLQGGARYIQQEQFTFLGAVGDSSGYLVFKSTSRTPGGRTRTGGMALRLFHKGRRDPTSHCPYGTRAWCGRLPKSPGNVARLVTCLSLSSSMLSGTPGCRLCARLLRAHRLACARMEGIGTFPK